MTSRKRQDTADAGAGSTRAKRHRSDGAEGGSERASKSYTCDFEGCGKEYSRSEHLHRHQLNHAPKEIFHCGFQDCCRTFVREDLRNRHRERHAQGSSLDLDQTHPSHASPTAQNGTGTGPNPGDASHAGPNPNVNNVKKRRVGRPSLAERHASTSASSGRQGVRAPTSVGDGPRPVAHAGDAPIQEPSTTHEQHASSPVAAGHQQRVEQDGVAVGHGRMNQNITTTGQWNGQSGSEFSCQEGSVPLPRVNEQNAVPTSHEQSNTAMYDFGSSIWDQEAGNNGSAIHANSYPSAGAPPRQSIDAFSLENANDSSSTAHASASATFNHHQQPHILARPSTMDSRNVSNQALAHYDGTFAMAEQVYTESPISVRDEFTSWLFDGLPSYQNDFGQVGGRGQMASPGYTNLLPQPNAMDYSADTAFDYDYSNINAASGSNFTEIAYSPGDRSIEPWIAAYKRQEIIDFMVARFDQGAGTTGQTRKEEIFYGDHDADGHVLSTQLMQHYVQSYWDHFHDQMPILHRPTFSTEKSPNLLVLAVMTIGASLLSKDHERAITDAAQRFANFVAWNLRWQVFMDRSFQPPAALWVFQTLILLEVYEKMNATRALHERANIHYATLINLMRRGTALVEESSRAAPALGRPVTPNEWWERWVTTEATRRAAFAAFLLDATHANMFGHTAVMVVHEIHLPLPCDQALWSATSPGEVSRVEASFHLNGIMPMTFLQALKRTLTGRKIRTNAFGRMIVMAGLQSVSWHLRQKELQMSTLGVPQATGAPETWRATLEKAFDFWKKDFDEELIHMRSAPPRWQDSGSKFEIKIIAENATVMHHLSRIAMNVDVTDCQILAGVRKLLGRTITDTDRERVTRKIWKWRESEGAKQAVNHSIQILQEHALLNASHENHEDYSARDDCLLSRPWILYFAALVLWCYNFSAQAPAQTESSPSRGSSQVSDSAPVSPMQDQEIVARYPPKTARRSAPDLTRGETSRIQSHCASRSLHQGRLETGDKRLISVLDILAATFRESRWELLHEAADRLQEATEVLKRKD